MFSLGMQHGVPLLSTHLMLCKLLMLSNLASSWRADKGGHLHRARNRQFLAAFT
jgi:hypothetical protein